MKRKKLAKGIRKYIRRQKALLKRQYPDPAEQQKKIKQLLSSFFE